MYKQQKIDRFNTLALPHLDAAYNLAKWLTQNPQDAEDLVQESYLKAFQYFDNFKGDNARVWLLMIVRNTCYTWLKSKHNHQLDQFDEQINYSESAYNSPTPEQIAISHLQRELLNNSMQKLPVEFREALILREQEGFSYHEISEITGSPVGTVMSRLSRGRKLLRQLLLPHLSEVFE